MWYFAWILGVLLACAFGIINALWLEHTEMMDKKIVNSISEQVAKLHAPLDKALFRALSLILGFYHVALLMWDPKLYADQIGGFNAVVSPLMIWAMCSSMVLV